MKDPRLLSPPFRRAMSPSVLRCRLLVVVAWLAGFGYLIVRAPDRDTMEVLKALTPLVIAIPAAWLAHSLQLAVAFNRDRREWRLHFVAFQDEIRTFVGKGVPSSKDKPVVEKAHRLVAALVVDGHDIGLSPLLLSKLATCRDHLTNLAAMPAPDQSENKQEQQSLRGMAEEHQAPLREAYHEAVRLMEVGGDLPRGGDAR